MARLDIMLVKLGISTSRERAKELIKNGSIYVNEKIVTKPSAEVSESDEIRSDAEAFRYVGRGGLKLEKAIDAFSLRLDGLKCIDIGASTGGFTDCMLQNGAYKVYAVDVGHDQLAEKLRSDSRVINAENTDVRGLDAEFFGGEADFISTDVSFISVKFILPKIADFLRCGCDAAVLVKPQFEAGKHNIGKNGIVKNRKVHEEVLADITEFAYNLGLSPQAVIGSPIRGGSGNIEYLMHLKKVSSDKIIFDFKEIVNCAFNFDY